MCPTYFHPTGEILEGRDLRTIPNTKSGWPCLCLTRSWQPSRMMIPPSLSGDLVQGRTTLSGKKLFLLFNLNIPSYIFVYCPIWYHLVALQRVWLCLLHNCSSSTAGQLRHPFSLLFIILNKPCSFHLPTAVQLSSSCQNAYCAGRVFCRKMNDYEIRKIQTVSLWISLHHFAVT